MNLINRNTILFSVFVTFLCGDLHAQSCVSTPSGLVSWWKGEGNALDQIGSNHGVISGTVPFVPAEVGQGFFIDGTGPLVVISNSPTLQFQNMTIEVWLRRASTTVASLDGNGNGHIFGYGLGGYTLYMDPAGHPSFGKTGFNAITCPAVISDTNLHHVVITKSGTTNVFYVDGTALVSPPYDPGFTFDGPVYIGGVVSDANFYGTVDEVSVYNRALSSSEVSSIYAANTAGKCPCLLQPAGLVSWWKGEGTADDMVDGNSGTLMNGASFTTGFIGSAFNFDGVNDHVRIPDAANLRLSTGVTLEAWIFPTAFSSTREILSKWDSPSGADRSYTFQCNGSGTVGLDISSDGGFVNVASVDSSTTVPLNQWSHVAGTYDGVSLKVYIDGVLRGTTSWNLGMFSAGHADLAIGCALVSGSFFAGRIDEPSIYNRALTVTEIQAIYNAGIGGKCFAIVAPAIVSQPTSQNLTAGTPLTLNVGATGTPPLSYQWSKDGTNIPGATGFSYSVSVVQPSDAGTYAVVVSNAYGSATSSNAAITVISPVCAPPPSGLVSWWRAELSTMDQTGTNHGTLYGDATYGSGRVGQGFLLDGQGDGVQIGNPASLQLQNFTIEAWIQRTSTSSTSRDGNGNAVIFGYSDGGYALYLSGNGELALTKFGVDNVTLSSPTLSDTAFHHVAVTKSGSTVVFYIDGVAYSVPAYGSTFTFNNSAAIGGAFQNYSFWGRIDEVSVYNRALASAEIQSIYGALIAGKCAPPSAPVIFVQPTNLTVKLGQSATFSVLASGTPQVSYQWMFGGTNIDGATGSSLTLTSAQFSNSGNYSVLVSNSVGSLVSSNGLLTVNPIPPCFSPPSGLLAWWPAEGNGTDTVSGTAGVLFNDVSFGSGMVGQGFNFDGNDDSMVVSNTPPVNFGTNDLSIEAWIKAFPNSTEFDTITLLDKRFNQGLGYELVLLGGKLFIRLNGSVSGLAYGASSPDLRDGVFHHIALSVNRNSATGGNFYVDGVVVGTFSTTALQGTLSNSSPLFIAQHSAGYQTSFKGVIDELSFYNRALASSEIQAIFNADAAGKCGPNIACVTSPFGLISWWKGEGNALDQIGGNHGVISGTVPFVPAEVGQGFFIDGTGPLVVISNSPTLQFQNMTIEVWLRRASTTVASRDGNGNGHIFGYGLGGYTLYMDPAGHPSFGKTGFNAITCPAVISDTNLHHVVITKSGTTNVFYVDGTPFLGPSYDPGFTFSGPVYIGGVASNANFYGTIDEVTLYSRQLSSNEVQAIYASVSGGKCSGITMAPFIFTQPANSTVIAGGNATFAVVAGGSAPLNYQWSFNGTNINGATASSFTVTNAQSTNAGAYSVLVTNAAGVVVSSNAVLTVNPAPSLVQVANTSGPSGGTVSVPVLLVANGSENALQFSLSFNTSRLTYVGTSLTASNGATLLLNESGTSTGRVGLLVGLPVGTTFDAGTQQIASVTFTTAILTNTTTTPVNLVDQPIVRQVSNKSGAALSANYANGTVSIAAVEFEADLSPRPQGDRAVTVTDWVLIGLFAAHLDSPTNSVEFQRADCAPRDTLGNGQISIIDWVQAGRYAAVLDPLTPVGGPTEPAGLVLASISPRTVNGIEPSRQVQVMDSTFNQGQAGVVSLRLLGEGNENALGFSLVYNPSLLSYTGVTRASAAANAALNVNTDNLSTGNVGLALALPSGTHFPTGAVELLKVTFKPAISITNQISVLFGDIPIPREISDPTAHVLPSDYLAGTISINPLPWLSIIRSTSSNVALSWPSWASNFVLQENSTDLNSTDSWSSVPGTVVTTNLQSTITLPINSATKFYRLMKP